MRRAAAAEAEFPILTGILIEVGDGAVVLTATDRYGCPPEPAGSHARPCVDGRGVRVRTRRDRRSPEPRRCGDPASRFRCRGHRHPRPLCSVRCAGGRVPRLPDDARRVASGPYRVVTRRDELFAVAEGPVDDTVRLVGASGQLTASVRDGPPQAVAARVDGPDVTLTFRRGNLLAALETAVGPTSCSTSPPGPARRVPLRDRRRPHDLAMPTASDI